MSNQNNSALDTETPVVEPSVDDSNNDTLNKEANASDSSDGSEVSKDMYLNQKARAEKAEAELKKLRNTGTQTEAQPTKVATPSGGLTRAEAILFAQGLTEEEVDKAAKIAQIEDVSLTESIDSPLFKAWKKSNDETKKSQAASLSASKGAPKAATVKSFETPDLARDDHKALFNKRIGK